MLERVDRVQLVVKDRQAGQPARVARL